MKRLLAIAIVAVAALAGCGNDTCTSSAADPVNTSPSCTLAPGTTATVSVQLCGKCTDSSPGCQAEFLGLGTSSQRLEVAPVVQQCQGNAGCAVAGCSNLQATCSVTVPAASGSYTLVVVGDTVQPQGTLTVSSGGSSSCAL